MGFFSWRTSDTNRPIYNTYSDYWRPMTVVMLAPDGRRWEEVEYEGYGIFGGKDFYELLAELNGLKTREDGIVLDCSGACCIKPRFAEDLNANWEDLPDSLTASGQGFWEEIEG